MPTRQVELTEELDALIEQGVASGRFRSASEMVSEALRRFDEARREDEAKVEWLRAAVQEGIDDAERGDVVAVSTPEERQRFFRSVHEEAKKKIEGQGRSG